MENESNVTRTGGDGDAAFLALHARREDLERDLSFAQQRQQFGTDPSEVAKAGEEERALLADLDAVMTQIRAAEYQRMPGARRW
ncbi:hypothetical protein [Methylobacterium marchantiae]|uniref:Uncharacterized protein n=1 Tax=Methylobacterium marchantiae TaxID=600331 RepID=A0ABW3WTY6_9HYPH|nr:hypothetical protein AIGOOFII_0796 [Methylobacterium marchantiae]